MSSVSSRNRIPSIGWCQVWATGEASASLGFTAARMFDELDPLEKEKDRVLAERGISGGTSAFKALRRVQKDALEYLALKQQSPLRRNGARFAELEADPLIQFTLLDSLANVYCPACKLWNTGHGANTMREAVSLVGGYGITEDCPGFLGHKWMDAQLEATYEGPEAVQRRQLLADHGGTKSSWRSTVTWITELSRSRRRTGPVPIAPSPPPCRCGCGPPSICK